MNPGLRIREKVNTNVFCFRNSFLEIYPDTKKKVTGNKQQYYLGEFKSATAPGRR